MPRSASSGLRRRARWTLAPPSAKGPPTPAPAPPSPPPRFLSVPPPTPPHPSASLLRTLCCRAPPGGPYSGSTRVDAGLMEVMQSRGTHCAPRLACNAVLHGCAPIRVVVPSTLPALRACVRACECVCAAILKFERTPVPNAGPGCLVRQAESPPCGGGGRAQTGQQGAQRWRPGRSPPRGCCALPWRASQRRRRPAACAKYPPPLPPHPHTHTHRGIRHCHELGCLEMHRTGPPYSCSARTRRRSAARAAQPMQPQEWCAGGGPRRRVGGNPCAVPTRRAWQSWWRGSGLGRTARQRCTGVCQGSLPPTEPLGRRRGMAGRRTRRSAARTTASPPLMR